MSNCIARLTLGIYKFNFQIKVSTFQERFLSIKLALFTISCIADLIIKPFDEFVALKKKYLTFQFSGNFLLPIGLNIIGKIIKAPSTCTINTSLHKHGFLFL